MMTFVLIYWILSSVSPSTTTGTAIFGDEASCKAALAQITAEWNQPENVASGARYGVAGGVCAQQSGVVLPQ